MLRIVWNRKVQPEEPVPGTPKRSGSFPAAWIVGASIFVVPLAVTLYAIAATGPVAGMRIAGTALILSGASVGVGALLGLLFGVPRPQDPEEPKGDTAEDVAMARRTTSARFTMNTNLGEVSDWLTKILVGVGLTQIRNVGPALATLSQSVATPFGPSETAQVFAGSVIVYLTVFGFIAGWLCSVLYLPNELSNALQARAEERAQEKVESTAERFVDRAIAYEKAALEVIQTALQSDGRTFERGHDAGRADGAFEAADGRVVVETLYRSRSLRRSEVEKVVRRLGGGAHVMLITPVGFTKQARKWVEDTGTPIDLVTWHDVGDDDKIYETVHRLVRA